MSRFVVTTSGGAASVKGMGDGDESGNLSISSVNAHRLIAALAMVMLDYINEVRTSPLSVLSAKTATDIVADIKAKL